MTNDQTCRTPLEDQLLSGENMDSSASVFHLKILHNIWLFQLYSIAWNINNPEIIITVNINNLEITIDTSTTISNRKIFQGKLLTSAF